MISEEGVEYLVYDGFIQIIPSDKPIAAHKITGTYIGALLGENKYKSAFQAQCELLGVVTDSFKGNDATEAGKALESRILNIYRACSKNKVVSGDEAFPGCDHTGPHNEWTSHLVSDDGCFAGNIDGLELSNDGRKLNVIEIKTTQNIKDWKDKHGNDTIPKQYLLQASLYAELLGIKDILFLVAAIDKDDIADPENCSLKDKVFFVRAEVPYNFKNQMNLAKASLLDIIMIPPNPTSRDKDVIKELYITHPRDDALKTATEEYRRMSAQIKLIEDSMADLTKAKETLKETIKEMSQPYLDMDASGVSCNGVNVIMSSKTSYDMERMAKDGIDISKYAKTTNFLTLKEEKQ